MITVDKAIEQLQAIREDSRFGGKCLLNIAIQRKTYKPITNIFVHRGAEGGEAVILESEDLNTLLDAMGKIGVRINEMLDPPPVITLPPPHVLRVGNKVFENIIMRQDDMEQRVFDYCEVSFDIPEDQGWGASDDHTITVDDDEELTPDEKLKLKRFKRRLPITGMLPLIMKDMCLHGVISPGAYEFILEGE